MKCYKIVLIIVFFGLLAGNLSAVSLIAVPNPKVAPVAQSFQIQVYLNTATSIRGYSIYFGFDQSIVQFVSASQGSLFTGSSVGWWNVSNISPGVVRVECIIFGPGLFVTGPGNMMNVNFTGLTSGYSAFTFNQVEIYDVSGSIIPNVETTNGNILIGANLAYMSAKCFLQGPYDAGIMATNLNETLPVTSPYIEDPLTVESIPTDAVDWLLLELRQSYNGTISRTQSVFLHSDGSITTPGYPFILFNGIAAGPYYVVIHHRNHISIMSNVAVVFAGSGVLPFFDFTQLANIYGTDSTVLLDNGSQGMAAGDADQDGIIGELDRSNFWLLQAGQSGYLRADFNLDGNVFPSDLNELWRINLGMSTDVP